MSINNQPPVTRRAFIHIAGVSAALGALSGCSPGPGNAVPPTSSAPGATAVPTVAAAPTIVTPKATAGPTPATAKGVLPTFAPTQGGPSPDFRSAGPLYEDGFINYPSNPVKSWQKAPAANGGHLTAVAPALYPPPTPYDQNPAWQAVNAALNTNFQFNIVPQADYATSVLAPSWPAMIFRSSCSSPAA